MKKIVVIGAGGKMGLRTSGKLKADGRYECYFCEISEAGINKLKEIGITEISTFDVVKDMDYVLLAIPDILIGKLSEQIIPKMKPGALVIGLDPAAAYAEIMPVREDIGYFVAHPHHPYLFNTELFDGKPDLFGGMAMQDCSCALYKGEEKFYAEGELIVRIIFGPVAKTFRVTVEQMAFCEPGLVESIGGPMIMAIKQAYEAVVKLGVPEEVAFSFMMGHLRVQVAITFGLIDAKYSDGAIVALNDAMESIFQPDWLEKMVNKDYISKSVQKITNALKK